MKEHEGKSQYIYVGKLWRMKEHEGKSHYIYVIKVDDLFVFLWQDRFHEVSRV